jgi:hypothetical protein
MRKRLDACLVRRRSLDALAAQRDNALLARPQLTGEG